jgi:hypothetical protein
MTDELEVTPQDAILGSGAGGPLGAPTPWISFSGYIAYASGGVVVGNPSGINKSVGSLNVQALFINGTIIDLTKYLPFTGGAMSGILTLSGDPINPLDAASKQYVDSSITVVNSNFPNYLPLAGGTLTGTLNLAADPTSASQAATKRYVDAVATGSFAIPDAPSDGNLYGRLNATWVNAQVIDVGTF